MTGVRRAQSPTESTVLDTALDQHKGILVGIAEVTEAPLFCKDVDGRYIFCTSAVESILGCAASELIGKTVDEVWEGEAAEMVHVADEVCLAGGIVDTTETFTMAGECHTLHLVQRPMRDVQGAITGVCGVIRDVTEVDAAEGARDVLGQRHLQPEKLRAMGRLAGSVAHDINNQLMSIMGYADILGSALVGEPRLRSYAEIISSVAKKVSKINGQLLSLSRCGPLISTSVDLEGIARQARDLLVEANSDQRLEVVCHPPGLSPVVQGDPDQLLCAFLSLVRNAKDAMPTGGTITLGVEIVALDQTSCEESKFALVPGKYGALTCRDTGQGMSPETLARALDPFFSTKEGDCVGLGLTVAFVAMKQHGGAVELSSVLGRGTEARLLIPLAAGWAHQLDHDAVHSEASRQVAGGRRGESILVVDDEPAIRAFLVEALSQAGYSVASCCDGEEAVRLVRREPEVFDLVMMDMIMPVMDGLTAYRAIKQLAPALPVVILSGYALGDTARAAMEEGVRAFIQKPVKLAELMDQITDILAPAPA